MKGVCDVWFEGAAGVEQRMKSVGDMKNVQKKLCILDKDTLLRTYVFFRSYNSFASRTASAVNSIPSLNLY